MKRPIPGISKGTGFWRIRRFNNPDEHPCVEDYETIGLVREAESEKDALGRFFDDEEFSAQYVPTIGDVFDRLFRWGRDKPGDEWHVGDT